MKTLHCAYNLTTGEILACGTGNLLKRRVRIMSENRLHNEWIFSHKGLNAIMAKANRIGSQRVEV